MTGKRYFERMWEEEYYIFDSETISENEFDEKVEYEDYQAFEDSLTGDEVVELLNVLNEKNDELRIKKNNIQKQHSYELIKKLEYKSELIDLKKENEQLKEKLKKYEEIEELKKEDFVNCHNCKHDRSVHDGVALDGMCAIKGLMNLDGYFDTEYHRLPTGTFCPYWGLEE